jgi:hypothetical protein
MDNPSTINSSTANSTLMMRLRLFFFIAFI